MRLIGIIPLAALALPGQEAPHPASRAEGFFGLHFDLHPGPGDKALGADVAPAMIEELLRRVKPDWIQYDCKGHSGWAGYPTGVGAAAPGIAGDSLALWREATRRHGVGLYIHYSGVWDAKAVADHPGWARVDEKGKPDAMAASVFGPYVDKLLIPQLQEAVARYDLDGLWVDGDCWGARLDWSPAAMAAWRDETGLTEAPRGPGDPRWFEWKMFHRRAFETYLERWVNALHKFKPGLQVTSNWMYTTFAPIPPRAALDFLSGDFVPTGAVDRARLEARYLAGTGRPWDLLAWGFLWGGGRSPALKTALQLKQEAAVVLAEGGAFQLYWQPTRSGHVCGEIVATAAEVAGWCRARQAICHRSESVPQVALLFGAEAQFDRSDAVFAPHGTTGEAEGALHALLESHFSVDVLAEHRLLERLDEYPLVVLPDTHRLPADLAGALVRRVEAGGSLLLLGERCARLFAPLLGVRLAGPPGEADAELATPGGLVSARGPWQDVEPGEARVLAWRFPERHTGRNGKAAATTSRHGRGRVGAVYGPVSRLFLQSHHPGLRRLVEELVAELLPEPAVTASAPPEVNLSLRRTRDGRLALHLVNLQGQPLGSREVVDHIPPARGVTVRLRVPSRPTAVRWLPEGLEPHWTWKDGLLDATIPPFQIHGALLLTP